MSIRLTSPTLIHQNMPIRAAVQSRENKSHDVLAIRRMFRFPQIEHFTDANRIDAFGPDQVADLYGQVLFGMVELLRPPLPADVVVCECVESSVSSRPCSTAFDNFSRLRSTRCSSAYHRFWCNLHGLILRIIGRRCSTTKWARHGCLEKVLHVTTQTRVAGVQ